MSQPVKKPAELRNEDPISGELGSHPVAAGVGTVLGGVAAGAIAGSVAGPIGTIVGTIVGGVAGGLGGKAVGESLDPSVETDFWKAEYTKRPYYDNRFGFDSYRPAYQAGWESTTSGQDWIASEPLAKKKFEEASWENEGGAPKLTWKEAKEAAKDAYDRASGLRGSY
jgi:hypothetical protein